MDFAFLIHSRDWTDVAHKFKIAKYLPKSWVEWWCLHWPPIVVSKITGLIDKERKEAKGWLIGIPMTAKQMMENRELAKKRIVQAIKKAEKLGAKIVGLGAFTSSLTHGGLDLIDKTNVKITTGNALTVGVALSHIQEIIKNHPHIQKIGVVGATGSIGQAITKILAKNFSEKEFFLFARTKENLDNLLKEVLSISPGAHLKEFSNNLEGLKEVDLIIVATSSPEAFIKSEYLKNSTIIYDITQPRNISLVEAQKKPDVKIYDGGLIIIPQLINELSLGLPSKTLFACLAETILLALENDEINYSLGKVEVGKIEKIMNLAVKYKFKPTPLIK